MKTNKFQKVISLLLALVMVLGMFPAAVFATEAETEVSADETVDGVTVYLTVSQDYDFIEANGTTMALEEVTVPYFDIGLYGLEDIYYNPDCYEYDEASGSVISQTAGTAETAEGNVTMLHLMIWATEVYYNGLSPEEAGQGWLANEGGWNGFSITTNPGSAFGSFWDFGSNYNYYLNYEYPLGAPGWGATCDQILLEGGDVVSIRYNAWTGDDGSYYHFGESGIVTQNVTQGEDVSLTLYATSEDWTDYTTGHTPVGEDEYGYVIPAEDMCGEHWDVALDEYETDANGSVTISTTDLEPGTYYVTSETHDPAVMLLVVEEAGHTHTYEDGVCTGCGEADPDYVPTYEPVTVYFSLSSDADYLVGEYTGEVMALKEISVPYFDLALYGLEDFCFQSENYGSDSGNIGDNTFEGVEPYEGKVTMLHLFIYATEVYYCGVDVEDAGQGYLYDEGLMPGDLLDVGGSSGSAFINYIWGKDMNLNYYLNYEYPLASEGWGATCDQILLHDGDIVTLGHFTGWSFYNDPTSIFNYIEADDAAPARGDEVMLTVYHAGPDGSGNYTTAHTPVDYMPDVYIAAVDDVPSGDVTEWEYLGTADENGELVLDTADLEPGQYVIAMAGQYGTDYPDEICSTPGAVLLTVEEAGHTHSYEAVVTAPTCTEGGYTTYTCSCGDTYTADETDALGHSYENGVCTVCGAADPDYVAEPVSVTIGGVHSAQVSEMKLYTYAGGVKGEENLLDGIETVYDSANYNYYYAAELVPGDYWVEGYDADGYYNGGIKITVTADGENTFSVRRMYQIYATNSGWVDGTDYTISVEVVNGSTVREVELGTALYSGNVRTSCLFLVGDTVKATFTPIGERAETAMAVTASKTPTANDYISAAIPESLMMTFVVPEGSEVDVGKLTSTYFVYEFYTAEGEPVEGETEGTEVWTFKVPKENVNASSGPYFFYRVQHEDGITYWDFFAPKTITETTVTLTEEDLYIGSAYSKNSIITDYSQNLHDTANIYLNINNQGYESMELGETYELNVLRNWQAIEHFYNRQIAIPDVNYEIITLEGSDVISIEPDENNTGLANMTATGEGTAIVLVTYDAMFSNKAMTDYNNSVYNQPCLFSATWPEFTGVFVVTVGSDGTSIDMGMTINRAGTESVIDAEHDFLYYVGDEGASYTFTPESGCTVTVSRGQVSETEMTFGSFVSDGVTVNEDGSVTVSGLTTGRHIIKVEKDGVANYQVVTARQTSYELQKAVTTTDEDGNVTTTYEAMTEEEIAQIKANDTVYIQFTNLVNPVEKLSGVYNFNARLRYAGEDGTVFTSNPGGSYGVYDFSSNPERQFIAITIPKYWTGDSYTLSGLIAMAGNGSSASAHRGVRYGVGIAFNPNSPSASMNVSVLPEITIPVAETEFLTGNLSFVDQNGDPITVALSVTMTDAEGNAVQVNEDGSFMCMPGAYSFVVNGAGVQYTTGSVTVTEDGENQFTVTLQTTSENAWDGITLTEPAQDENGVYLIGTGAELAWFSAQNQNKVSATGKLIADIDLGNYPWNNTNTSTGSYTTILDGDGHEIYNFNSTKALFGTICGGSEIRNLTIRGEINGTGSNGALVGYAYGSNVVIENCVSYVTVNSTGSSVGGLVGYAATAVIRNCVNHGAVSGSGSVGGIIGSFVGATTVTGCYNTGAVSSTGDRVGGIFGGSGYDITVTGCYNTGAISGANYVGGIGGQLASSYYGTGYATASDCYNVGSVTGTGSNVGGAVGGVAYRVSGERIYYLEGTAESDVAAVVLTEEEMKSADLDTSIFGGTCDGYPALLWQTDVTFHTDSDGAVVAPNCTEKGYTEYTCAECGVSYRKEYVDALGHDWCEDTEGCDDCVYTAPTCTETGSIVRNCRFEGCEELKTEVIPANGHTADESQTVEGTLYNDCVCAVCGESYRVWHDERVQYMTLTESCIGSITLTDNTYPWNYNAETGRFESTNKGVNSSTAQTTIELTLTKNANVSFNYGVSSEANWDKMTITAVIGEETLNIADAISGTQESAFAYELPAGTYTLTFSYAKDSSSASGSDIGWFSDLKIECVHAYESVTTDPTCTEDGYTTYTCTLCGDSYVEAGAAATGHTYKEWDVAPTCTEDGYTCHECINEGCDSYFEDNTVPATGHSFGEWTLTKEPTCTEKGEQTRSCANCDETEKREVSATGHTCVTEIIAPTCTEQGYTKNTCQDCGEVIKSDFVDALGHTSDGETDCSKESLCTVCGETIREAGEHSWDEGVVTSEATCTEEGLMTYTCVNCGAIKEETINKAEHTEEVVPGKDATCTEDGLTEGKKCAVCGETLAEQEVIPATGHSYEDGKCTACGEKDPDASTGSGWGSWWDKWFGSWWGDDEEEEPTEPSVPETTEPEVTEPETTEPTETEPDEDTGSGWGGFWKWFWPFW